MRDTRKRSLIKLIGLSAVSLAALTACGKKEEAPAPAAAPEPAFDIASGMPFAAPRNLSAGTPPVLADLEPPLADIDTPDAFRDAQALDASRARGNSRA